MDGVHLTVVSDYEGLTVKFSLTFLKQDCFKQNWTEHKRVHKIVKAAGKDEELPCASKCFVYKRIIPYVHCNISLKHST